MTLLPSERHLRPEGLKQYLANSAPTLVSIAGEPLCQLAVDPLRHRVSLRVPWTNEELPDLSSYRRFFAEIVVHDGQRWGEFGAEGDDVLIEAYPVMCAVADHVQQEGKSFATAIRFILNRYHELLRGIGRLTDQQEVGLFGELMVLNGLIDSLGEEVAVAAWRGAISEEHDFGLPAEDVEVKTTIGEYRRHWVSSATQLEPTVGRPLWLMSIQITAAGAGGLSLPDLIDRIRNKIPKDDIRASFDVLLTRVRWRDDHSDYYRRRFRLRTEPALYEVDRDFPSITRAKLRTAHVPIDRISGLTYQIDLSSMTANKAPPALSFITERHIDS